MAMTMETVLVLAVMSLVVMLLRNDDRSVVARIPATSRRVRSDRDAA